MSKALLASVETLQQIGRADLLTALQERQRLERERADVTGRWVGYTANGDGLVNYQGRIYEVRVLATKCRQRGAPVNLRRTPDGNFADWA